MSDDGDCGEQPNPLEELRARHAADMAARKAAEDARRKAAGIGDDDLPADPLDQEAMDEIAATNEDLVIWEKGPRGDENTWIRFTYKPRGIKLVGISMGHGGSKEPDVDLIISDDEAHGMIAGILATIGPDRRPPPPPDPPVTPRTAW
jgi:hypothetical protein